jgi:conjugative relaxase-like TrwC/TraI family protein
MLSIGKLAVGQERYYEQQVAQGLDDYFTGRGESPGRWLGSAAAELGLRGMVEDGQLSMLMEGRDPRTGPMLREQPVRVAALDLTFSAPKSVSVLHAVANERISSELVACHEEAVEAALVYLEETAVLVARRTGPRLSLHEGGGFVTAAFRHRRSRALDPQLHTHCVSANMARGRDGRWTALHHPTLFRAAQTAGYLYQAHLRALVRERLGLEWGQVRKGAAELEAIDRGVLEEFSRRRHEMLRDADEGGIGLGSRSASQAAVRATRSRKQYGIETGSWREGVRARAAEHGLDRAERRRLERAALNVLDGRHRQPVQDSNAERLLSDRLAGPSGLTELQNTFDRRAVLRALAEAARDGERIGVLVERADRFVERQDVLVTERGELTTAELVAVERRLIAAAQGRASAGVGRVDPQIAASALAQCGRALTEGQRKAVEATVSSGHGVQVIEALAGTGKTYTAGVLRHVYERGGYAVVGVAPTGRAVRELAEQAGIPSRTLDSLLVSLQSGDALPRDGVVVLDEAGMAATRQTATLLQAAQEAGCKVVAIGDPRQLHSVQAGGWMRAVGRRVGTLRLSEVLRQRDPLERRALAALHEGASQRWLEWARRRDRVARGTGAELLGRAVSEWRAAAVEHGLAEAVLIARDNDTRRALNERARALVREHGGLGEQRCYGPVQIAVGDRVICRRNDRRVDVDNGTRGTVRAVHEREVAIEIDAGTLRRLPAAYVAEHVEHAYALTGHGMQGGTVERAFVVAAPHELTKGWSYTALSRARGQTRLFTITDHEQQERDEVAPGERDQKPTEKEIYVRIARYMQTRDDEDLAIEQLAAELAAGRADDAELQRARGVRVLQEASAGRAGPPVSERATVGGYGHAQERLQALGAQLEALKTPEVARLGAAERRERELIAHQDELTRRAERIPPAPRPAFVSDRHAAERANLQRALDGVSAELDGVRILRDRLVREIGRPDQIRAERAALEHAVSRAQNERDELLKELVARELATEPVWAREAVGERPARRRERDLWDRAARGLARYRLAQGIVDERQVLGERPREPAAATRYEQARSTLERVQRELGVRAREEATPDPGGVPRHYYALLGDARARVLEAAVAAERERVHDLPDEKLRALVSDGHQAIGGLDHHAAAQALRLERQHAHHQDAARKQTERAAALEQQASALGWRARHDREQLRHDEAIQHDHATRHSADTERLELELFRLRATGRHPDQWLRDNGQALVTGIAAAGELSQRHQRAIDRQAELAVTQPPAHVRELIGERPISGVRLAQEWERLAARIERHRLEYELELDRDNPLGPEPSQIAREQRHAYQGHREQLAAEIEHYRQTTELPVHTRAHEITGERRRDQWLGRER